MPFLSINGIEFPAAVNSARESVVEIGETTRAFDGSIRMSRQNVKRELQLESTPMLSSDALAWDSLIRGLGEVWRFDSHLYGVKGTGPVSGTGTVNTAVKHGNGLGVSALATIEFPVDPTFSYAGAWTWMGWTQAGGGGALAHHIIGSNGHKWADGVRNDALSTGYLTMGLTMELTGDASVGRYFDDVVFLPYAIPDEWPPLLYAYHNARPFSALSLLEISGDAVPENTYRSAKGNVMASGIMSAVLNGSWRNNLRTLSVLLQEA